MKVIDHIKQANSTLVSFEVLPPLKGKGIEALYKHLDPLMEFKPAFINVTYHRSEHVFKKNSDGSFKKGTLTQADLPSTFSTGAPGSEAAFAVRDAHGYAGYYKCNIFAMELARRAGFEVPVASRPRGYGYPGPDAVTADAADGAMREGWGRVVTGVSADAMDSSIVRGDGAFLLTSSGHEGHSGHMGIVERVHSIDYDAEGRVARIVFDGWEARSSGAMHLTQRTWSTYGNGTVEGGRGGLDRIEIVQLQRPDAGEAVERPIHSSAPASVLDAPTDSAATSSP